MSKILFIQLIDFLSNLKKHTQLNWVDIMLSIA